MAIYRYLVGAGVALVMTALVTFVSFLLSSPFLERYAQETTVMASECAFDNTLMGPDGPLEFDCQPESEEDPIFAFFERFLTPGDDREDSALQRQINESVRTSDQR